MPLERSDLDEERAGFFKPFSQSVMRSLSADQWTAFCGLGSDEQRVAFVYDLPEVRQVALQQVYKQKDEAEAKARKDEGNKLFSEGNYAGAMRCYSQAMAKSPFKGMVFCWQDGAGKVEVVHARLGHSHQSISRTLGISHVFRSLIGILTGYDYRHNHFSNDC